MTTKEVIKSMLTAAILATIIALPINMYVEHQKEVKEKVQQYDTLTVEREQIEQELKDYDQVKINLQIKGRNEFDKLVVRYFEKQRATKIERLNHVKSIMKMLENENIPEILGAKNE